MAKKASKKQVAANRRNAKKSTGPKTTRGKNVVKFNAVKHGLTAESTIITTDGFDESAEELSALQSELYDEFQPVGVMEELLVKKIAIGFWRERRILKAEVGEIEKNWERYNRERLEAIKNKHHQISLGFSPSTSLDVHCNHSEGILRLLGALEGAREDIRDQGYVTEDTERVLIELFGERNDPDVTLILSLNEEFADDDYDGSEEACEPSKADLENKAKCEATIKTTISRYTNLLELAQKREEHERRIHRLASCLPSKGVSDRLLRYQTAVDRQTNEAIRQLQQLQDRRKAKGPDSSDDR